MRKLTIISALLIFILAIGVNAQQAPIFSFNNVGLPNAPVSHNGQFSFQVEVTNNGVNANGLTFVYESVFPNLPVGALNLPVGALVTLSPSNQFNLVQNGKQPITVTVIVPNHTPPGNYLLKFSLKEGQNVLELHAVNFVVSEDKTFTLSADKTSVTAEDGGLTKTVRLTMTNTGNVDLQNALVEFYGNDPLLKNVFKQGDNFVRFTYPPNNDAAFNLPLNGAAKEVVVNIVVDNGFNFGDYKGEFRVSAQGFTTKNVPFTVTVGDNLCESGITALHNLNIVIDEPDNDDEIKPGDTIKLKVDVENNNNEDKRVKVEASLVNMNSGKRIDTQTSEDMKIKDGEEETFEMELTMEIDDVDDGDDLRVFVKAYEKNSEATRCNEAFINLDAAKEDEDVRITSFKLLPQTLACGQTGEGIIEVKNFGAEDQDVRVKLVSSALGFEKESNQFELEEGGDDSEATVRLRIDVPADAKAKEHEIEARVLYAGNDASSFANLIVTCEPEDTVEDNTKVASVNTEIPSITARAVQNAPAATVSNEVPKSFFDNFKTTRETPVALWVLADLILVLIIVFIIALVIKRR